MTIDEGTCASRWKPSKDRRIRDLRKLLDAWNKNGGESDDEELGTLDEYGLSFDYVAPGTFRGQDEGYWRYQISWGGPSNEFRFYAGGCGEQRPYRISYVFLDWFDGHERALDGPDLSLMRSIWSYFAESGTTEYAYRKGNDCWEG